MTRKLIKPWNKLPAGAAVTTVPAEQVVLVDGERLALLEKEGHLAPTAREIPGEVRTAGSSRLIGRPLDDDGSIELRKEISRGPIAPPVMDKGGRNEPPATPRPESGPVGQSGETPPAEEP